MKRLMKKHNPDAFMAMAAEYESGGAVFQSDTKALEMYIRAAELGNAEAFEEIAEHYGKGKVVEQDESKALVWYEIAAKKGSIEALSSFHGNYLNIDESVRHCIVAASAGDKESMDDLMDAYKDELLSKQDLTQALRAFQTSSDEMNSDDRDIARMLEEAYTNGEEPSAELLDRLGHGFSKRSCKDQGDDD